MILKSVPIYHITKFMYVLIINTYDLFLVEVSAAVGGGEGGRTGLAVPWDVTVLRGAADGEGVDAVGVSVAVAAVPLTASVTRCPHEDGAQPTSTLRHMQNTHVKVQLSHLNMSQIMSSCLRT